MKKHNNDENQNSDEAVKRRQISLVKIGVVMILAFIVWVFSSIAWFSMNKSVTNSGMSVSVDAAPFELEVANEQLENADLYSLLDSSDRGSADLRTSTAADTIRWRLEGTDGDLKPGSQGKLNFRIISNTANVNSIVYSLDIDCYSADTETVDDEEVVSALHKIVSTSAQEQKDGADYLRAHLMFFKSRSGADAEHYQYSGFIPDISNFTLTPDTANSNETVIYWIWPNTFGQIALDSSSEDDLEYLVSGAVSVLNSTGETNDRTALTNYLKSNAAHVFKGSSSSYYSEQIDLLYSKRGNTPEPLNYQFQYDTLSGGYNSADLAIGKNVNYVSLLLNATVP